MAKDLWEWVNESKRLWRTPLVVVFAAALMVAFGVLTAALYSTMFLLLESTTTASIFTGSIVLIGFFVLVLMAIGEE